MDDSDVMISFCIPIHNGKKYIQSCIESIARQDLKSFEILCVEDCSTDGSYEELIRLQSFHPQIRVIRNPSNKGVSYSRNTAVKAAKGRYIWFVDSDDLLADNAANQFVAIAAERDADAVIGKCYCFYEDDIPAEISQEDGEVKQASFENPRQFYQRDQYGAICYGLWLGVFKRSFLVENNLFFYENLSILEDVAFYFELGLKAKRVFLFNRYGYLYRIRAVSVSHSGGDRLMRRYFEASLFLLDLISVRANETDEYRDSTEAHLLDREGMAANYLVRISDKQYVRAGLNRMKKSGYYPYRYSAEKDYRQRRKRDQIITGRIIPNEPLFWTLHYLILAKRKLVRIFRRR